MRWLPVALILVACGATADAKFAATQGFSGKHGVDCGACHIADPMTHPPVVVRLLGLPSAWEPNASYELKVEVSGGPAPNPVPGQPSGGFDLETDAGSFAIPSSMEGLLRSVGPREMTYTGAGTLRRDWTIQWISPTLERAPASIRFWLAGLAANGNHVMNGPDTAGERGDRHATAIFEVPASEAAMAAWKARPLSPPVLEAFGEVVPAFGGPRLVNGRVADDADGAEWRLDDSPWKPAIGAPHFFFNLPSLDPGPHLLEARALQGGRVSEPARLTFRAEASSGASSVADAPSAWPVAVMVGAFLLLLSPLLLKLRR